MKGIIFNWLNVLGVDKELGFSLSTDKYFINPVENHFISADSIQFDFGGRNEKYLCVIRRNRNN
ncbi:lacto-N-biose phosphorylase central domain-containing protein [Bacillus pacificus]